MITQNTSIKFQGSLTKSTLEGVVNIRKRPGPSSFSIVNSVKKILRVNKAGHIGTLDPLAEGVLPVCLNRSTKIIQFLDPLYKCYQATLILGIETDTQDATGKVIAKNDSSLLRESDLLRAFEKFTGTTQQTPPMFSAKKNKGVPLYKLARNGITIDRNPVPVHIESIRFIAKEGPQVTFSACCSKGTYIRTLCHDMGRLLGCGAHMKHLVRTQIGMFSLSNSVSLEELEKDVGEGTIPQKLFSVDQVLSFLPEIRIKDQNVHAVTNGMPVLKAYVLSLPHQLQSGHKVRVMTHNQSLLAVAESLTDENTFRQMNPEQVVFKSKKVFVH